MKNWNTLKACRTYPAEGSHLMFALFLHEDRHVHDDAANQDDVVDVRGRHLDQSVKEGTKPFLKNFWWT